MHSQPYSPPSDETTASYQGGCLSGFIIPPLFVVCVGIVLAFVLLGASPASTISAAPANGNASFLQANSDQLPTVSPAIPNPAGDISPIFQPAIQYWSVSIQNWATAAGLDPNLVATVMQIESCGDPAARSGAGAMGLFQVMPFHFTASDDPYNPDTNAARGLAYLKRSLTTANGDARLALAGYNGGIGVIGRSETSWAGETQRYAYYGSGIYADAASGLAESPRLQEWLIHTGGGLCRQANSRLGITP